MAVLSRGTNPVQVTKRSDAARRQAIGATKDRVTKRRADLDAYRDTLKPQPIAKDANTVNALNEARDNAIASGQNPYSGNLRNYQRFAATYSNPTDQSTSSSPTVITDTNIRERVGPQLQQEAADTLGRYDQNGTALQQQRMTKEQQQAESKDPMAELFSEKESYVDPYSQRQLDMLDRLMASKDASTRMMAEREKAKFDRQRAQQQEVANAEQGALQTAVGRLGSRYTPGAMGQIMANAQRQNLEKLAQIDEDESYAMEELRLAQENFDLKTMSEKLGLLKDIRNERIATLEEKRKVEREEAEKLDKERTSILRALGESGAPADVIAAVSAADSVAEMVTLAGSNLQTGEYAEYARAVRNAGLTPVDPSTYYSKKIYGEGGAPGSDVFGGPIPFEATIDGAAALAGSVTGEKSASEQLKALAASGDYASLLTRMESLARKGMGSADGGEVFAAQNQVKAIDDLQAVLNEYEALGGELGPLPATEKAMAQKIGQLSGDPRFAELATRMTVAFQKYRQEMSGAAFGVQENAQYKSVVPTGDKSFELNRAVIGGLREFLSNRVDNAYETQLGEGYKNVKDYVELGLTPEGKKLLKTEQEARDYALKLSEQDPAFEEQVANIMADNPEWGYQEVLENMGISSSSNQRVSTAAGNRPQRNNNPGNVKVGGLADQFAKKGPDGKPLTDEQGHLIFATAEDGMRAIRADINAKLSGNSPAAERKLGRQIVTLADLNKVYAEDPNWKNNVAAFAGVTPDVRVNDIPRETLINAIMKAEGFFA